MSYLVDALKKAERERHQRQTASMESLSASESPYQRRTGNRATRWIVVVLVAGNLGMVGYFFGPGAGSLGDQQSRRQAAMSTAASTEAPDSSASPTSPAQTADAHTTPGAAAEGNKMARVSDQSDKSHSGDRPQARLRRSEPAPRSNPQQRSGQVSFAQSPLGNSRSSSVENDGENRQSRRQQFTGSLPQVHINGHLYSSVPGRSFILVNGRRYHEGERLAAGPAVESIDVAGATLNYRGQRYHVSGPG